MDKRMQKKKLPETKFSDKSNDKMGILSLQYMLHVNIIFIVPISIHSC